MDLLGYEGKRVIVSGCYSGMGEATTRMLLEMGAEVHGLDFKETKLKMASFHQVDLRDPASIDAAVDAIDQAVEGHVDALFNCAGLPQTAAPMDVMKVNFIGTRYLTEKIIPLMDSGSAIVSISSNGGMGWSQHIPQLMEFIGHQGFEEAVNWCEAHPELVKEGYAFSKEAVVVWTLQLSSNLIKDRIRINCTLPGPTQTPMMNHFEAATDDKVLQAFIQPINRRSAPEEQASVLVFLNSEAATYINGLALPVDGGFMAGMATGQIDMSVFAEMAAAQ